MPTRDPKDGAWINTTLPAYRRVNRLIPASHRCKRCWAPFSGPFAFLYGLFAIRPSRKNPTLCTT